jgi:hypothetical protein
MNEDRRKVSWQEVLKIHPAAEKFDRFPPDELSTLAARFPARALT